VGPHTCERGGGTFCINLEASVAAKETNSLLAQPGSLISLIGYEDRPVVEWSEFLAINPLVPGSIPIASRFSEKQRVSNGVHSAS
jgi:hypothetical protein